MKSLNEIREEQEDIKLFEDASLWGVPFFMLAAGLSLVTAMSGPEIENWMRSKKAQKIGVKIKSILGANSKAKKILKKLMQNKEAMEDIKNAGPGMFRAHVQKYVPMRDYIYIDDIIKRNLEDGELSDAQTLRRSVVSKLPNYKD